MLGKPRSIRRNGADANRRDTLLHMLVAVMEQGLDEGLRKTEAVMALKRASRKNFGRMIRAHLDTIFGRGNDFIPVLLYDWRSVTPATRRRIIALRDRYDTLWQQIVDELSEAGLLRGDRALVRSTGAPNGTGQVAACRSMRSFTRWQG